VRVLLPDGYERMCASPHTAPYVWDPGAQGFRLTGACTTVAWPIQASPTPCPKPMPTPIPPNGPGNCPAGYVPLILQLPNNNNHTFGLDLETVAPCQTNHYCANLPVDVSELRIFTADRSGPSQCGNVPLTVTP